MSYKRSRTTYEADLHAPYATFGTPLPDDSETRDDGSYLPLWKQEVRDERGRKRLHGAFTGGWSAGYFNSVGSKEGWTPSSFVSSRSNRRKDDTKTAPQQRAEDYMDEEDLADAAEAQQLQTSQAFAGLGASTQGPNAGGLMGLLKAEGDTMGLKLLRKMGWKDGQGIGPKVRRSARLDLAGTGPGAGDTHLFAPDNTDMIHFVRKVDRKGLGHDGEAKLAVLGNSQVTAAADEEEADDDPMVGRLRNTSLDTVGKNKPKPGRGGIGVGILNDTGSDEEDPYEIGPKIRYNRVIGGDKKKKKAKKAVAAVNPALRNVPVFLSKTARAGNSLGRCHDGRLPLDGFVLAKIVEDLTELLSQYAPPPVPSGWVSSKTPADGTTSSSFVSTADAAKASTHDAKSRAALLGEKSLPGKSVFDFISSTARDRLATGSGKTNLPPGLGQVPEGFAMSEEEKQQALWDEAPKLDRETAVAAISRGSSGPYADDEAKKARYRTYLEHFATGTHPLPSKPMGMTGDEFLRELGEFYNCSRIFKPMTGFMASRFTTAKKATPISTNGSADTELLSKPEPKLADPAEEAAKVGMYGKLTRTVEDFYPTRLLCKRFNVKAPAHSQPDNDAEPSSRSKAPNVQPTWMDREAEMRPLSKPMSGEMKAIESAPPVVPTPPTAEAEVGINPDKNEAVEGKAAHDEETGIGPSVSLEFEKKTPSATSSSASSSIRTTSIRHLDTSDPDPQVHILLSRDQSPPPQYPASEASTSRPPPFSSLFSQSDHAPERVGKFVAVVVEGEASGSAAAPAYEPSAPRESRPFDPDHSARAFRDPVAETKRALPRDTKGDSSRKDDDAEPPPAYSEGDSPLLSFSYLMAAAGGASSIITQVQQAGPPVNTIGGELHIVILMVEITRG
ncbi:dipeptidyl-peptidase iii [Ilyonectria robusta]